MGDQIIYYHLYNRGCNQEKIFYKNSHYIFLLRKINRIFKENNVWIVAYCLMPNHYHLLVGCNNYRIIAGSMRIVMNGFVQAVNKDINRKGTLFESRMKHILIDDDAYLIQLVRYIHLNPVIAGLCNKPEEWQYSNCQEWLGLRNENLFDFDFFKMYFETHVQYEQFIEGYQKEKMIRKYIFNERS